MTIFSPPWHCGARQFRCRNPYYTTLYYSAIYYSAIYYTAIYYSALHYSTLNYPALHCLVQSTILPYTILHYNTLHYTILPYATLHCTILHCTSAYSTLHTIQCNTLLHSNGRCKLYSMVPLLVSVKCRYGSHVSLPRHFRCKTGNGIVHRWQ